MGSDIGTGSREGPPQELLPPNHPGIYDRYRDQWWRSRGPFAALHWLARSRSRLIPEPTAAGQLLVDVGCGAGLMGPYTAGYRYVGFDISASAVAEARRWGVEAVQADATALPLPSATASVVLAGEILEHVADLDRCLDEVARILRPGGTLVFDTINDTSLARWLLVRLGERIPAGPPSALHDPSLFIAPRDLAEKLADREIESRWWGLRPSIPGYLGYLLGRTAPVELVPSRLESVLYQGVGSRL